MSRSRVLDLTIVATVMTVVMLAVRRDPAAGIPEFVFGTVVVLSLFAVLRLGWHAGRRAVGESTRADRLARTPQADVIRRAVAVERARLSTDIQAVVRTAATAMGAAAETATRQWEDDPRPALHTVQQEGERAGSELRRLLGLLREEADADQPSPPATPYPRISLGDVILATAVVALAVGEYLLYSTGERDPASALLTACAAAPIVLRRAAPGLGAAVCGLVVAVSAVGPPVTSGFWILATGGGLAGAAVGGRRPRDAVGLVLLWAGVTVGFAVNDPDELPINLLVLGVATVGGAVVQASEAWGRASRARADRRAAELAVLAESAVRAERLAVARELHDVVSHAVGVMVMQAGAALATRDSDPERARRALEVVRRTAASTLEELDRLVEVMGQDLAGGTVASHDGHDLGALVERMRGAGLAVHCELEGAPSGEAGAVAYRVVQEALTNVIRHAPGAGATVRVHAGDAGIEVEVVDDGPGPDRQGRAGYGLVGIDERVRRLGGQFSAGRSTVGRGFRVSAVIPERARSQA